MLILVFSRLAFAQLL
jgi:hypothetical protein